MAQITGLDIGHRAIRAVVLDGSGRKLVAAEEIPLGSGKDPWPGVRDMFSTKGISKRHVWAALNDRECIARDMRVPFTNEDQIKQTIRFSAEEVIPDDVDGYLLDHRVIEIEEAETHLMICAGRRKDIGEKLRHLQEAGLDPDGVSVAGLALYNLGTLIADADEFDEPFMILDIGAGTADIVIGDRERLRFIRSILIHRENHTEAGELDTGRLEKIFKEVRRTLWSGGVDGHAEVVWVCGGMSRNPQLAELVSQAFEIPAEVMPVEKALGGIEAEVGGNLGPFAQAVGVALSGTGVKLQFAPNFRRDEFVRQPLLLQVRVGLILLLLVMMGGVFWDGWQRLKERDSLKKTINTHVEWEELQYAELLAEYKKGENPLDYTPDRDEFAADPAKLYDAFVEAKMGVTNLNTEPNVLQSIKILSEQLFNFKDFELNSLSVTKSLLTLRGTLPDSSRLRDLEDLLKTRVAGDGKQFHSVDVKRTVKPDKVEFTITLRINRDL